MTEAAGRVDPGLTGVPETLLWTLWHRVLEARRPDAALADPLAVELVGRIDYPFAERFGESLLGKRVEVFPERTAAGDEVFPHARLRFMDAE